MKCKLLPILVVALLPMGSMVFAETQLPSDREKTSKIDSGKIDSGKKNSVKTKSIGSVQKYCDKFPDAPECKKIEK